MSQQPENLAESIEAVTLFLSRSTLWRGDTLQIDHPHNGKVSVRVDCLCDLVDLAQRAVLAGKVSTDDIEKA